MNEFLIKLIANGGQGSGNFNPGQGRGVGKPDSGSKISGDTSKNKEVHNPPKTKSDVMNETLEKSIESFEKELKNAEAEKEKHLKKIYDSEEELKKLEKLVDSGTIDEEAFENAKKAISEFQAEMREYVSQDEKTIKLQKKNIEDYRKLQEKFKKKDFSKAIDPVKAFEDISDYLGNKSEAKSLLKEYQFDDQKAIDKLAEYTGSRREAKKILEAAEDY